MEVQVDVAATVAQLLVAHFVEHPHFFLGRTLLSLDHRQRPHRLGQHPQATYFEGLVAGAGDEERSFDADDVAQVEQFDQGEIVAQEIAPQVDLDLSAGILEVGETRLALDSLGGQPARQAKSLPGAGQGLELSERLAGGVTDIEMVRIGLHSEIANLLQLVGSFLEKTIFHRGDLVRVGLGEQEGAHEGIECPVEHCLDVAGFVRGSVVLDHGVRM